MLRYSKFLLTIFVINLLIISCKPKEDDPNPKYSDEIENKIKHVENSLDGPVQIEGEKRKEFHLVAFEKTP